MLTAVNVTTMTTNKNYFLSLSMIPPEFIHEQTTAMQFGGTVIIANPNFEPMKFNIEKQVWEKIIFTPGSFLAPQKKAGEDE